MCFGFSLQLLFETFFILRRTAQDMVKKYIRLLVKYPLFLSDFNETGICNTDFQKILGYKISRKVHPVGAGLSCADG